MSQKTTKAPVKTSGKAATKPAAKTQVKTAAKPKPATKTTPKPAVKKPAPAAAVEKKPVKTSAALRAEEAEIKEIESRAKAEAHEEARLQAELQNVLALARGMALAEPIVEDIPWEELTSRQEPPAAKDKGEYLSEAVNPVRHSENSETVSFSKLMCPRENQPSRRSTGIDILKKFF